MISSKLAEIASFSFGHEAHIARIALERVDVPVFITDEHTINMQWMYSGALGGVRLLVHIEHEKLARETMATDFSEYLTIETEEILCPNCKSTNLENHTFGKISALATLFLLGIPLLFHRRGIKCGDCGETNKI